VGAAALLVVVVAEDALVMGACPAAHRPVRRATELPAWKAGRAVRRQHRTEPHLPGSLATLLWRRIVHAHEEETDIGEFTRLGVRTVPLILVASTLALWLALQVV
jgi:hypothetical protein